MRFVPGALLRSTPLVASALGAVLACDNSVDPFATITVEITPAHDTLSSLRQSVQLTALVRNARGERFRRAPFAWTSSDTSVAIVSTRGLVTAVGNGVARIAATVAGVSDTADLTVRQQVTGLVFGFPPASAVAGEAMAPAVTVKLSDARGNPVADVVAPVTLTLGSNPGASTLSGMTTQTTVGGIATFSNLWLDKAATGYTLVATAPGQNPATSGGFSVVPGAPLLAFLTQPGTAEGQVAFDPPIQVTAREDRFGNTITSVAVEMAMAASPTGEALKHLSGYTAVTTTNGVATFRDLALASPGDGFVLKATTGTATPARSDPFSVRLTFVGAVAGNEHSCGMTVAGFVYCWGADNAGQLGTGDMGTPHLSPAPVVQRFDLFQLSAGGEVTCATTKSSGACWGSNWWGELGDGTTYASWTPVIVARPFVLAQMSTGGTHTCGVTTERLAYCWGGNWYGQLGDGTTSSQLTPVPVSGGQTLVQVSAGMGHTCAVTTANAAYCWGVNNSAQLGDGTANNRLVPTPVQGGLGFLRVSARNAYTCGVTTDHTAYCWGWNGYGQLGDGTTQLRLQPTPVSGGLAFDSVSAGGYHTCGLATNGAAYCWGDNAYGQLGDGSTSPSLQPTPVTGGLTFLQLSAGLWHTCGAATDRITYCWGRNDRGQLGNGGTDQKLIPTAVVH